MTPTQAYQWMMAEFGEIETDSILHLCARNEHALEAIVVTKFHACDPRRQMFRRAVRALIEEMKGNQ